MTAPLEDLGKLAHDLRFQSTNPYNNSRKEKHVRDQLADFAARAEAIHAALTPKKGRVFVTPRNATPAQIRAIYEEAGPGDTVVVRTHHREKLTAKKKASKRGK